MKSNPSKLNFESGVVLIIFLVVLVIAAATSLFVVLDSSNVKIEREKKTARAMAEAKAALIGFVIKKTDVGTPAYLPNPDLHLSGVISEGSESGNSGSVDISLIGKFPWLSLDTSPLKDGWNECLWYVVSGRYKKSPNTSIFNWDTQGQIDVIDEQGNLIASNLAGLIVAPGAVLADQNRSTDVANKQCGGNYDARNYLDTYTASNAIAGEVNYFSGSTNNRQASNSLNKKFVLANNDYYNDLLLFLTTDDLFNPIMRRSDFTTHVETLLADPYFQTVNITGTKGTADMDCDSTLTTNQTFCNNWSDMLLLTQLPSPAPITIDGVTTPNCSRVIIFGGKKDNLQTRITATHISDPANYLEGVNLTAFNTPSSDFEGNSTFDPTNPSTDIMKCL